MQICAAVRQVYRVIVRLAHLPAVNAQKLGHVGKQRFRNGENLFLVNEIEAAGYFTGQLDVGQLIHAHRHAIGLVHDDVRRL